MQLLDSLAVCGHCLAAELLPTRVLSTCRQCYGRSSEVQD